jgi:hypothetical protein
MGMGLFFASENEIGIPEYSDGKAIWNAVQGLSRLCDHLEVTDIFDFVDASEFVEDDLEKIRHRTTWHTAAEGLKTVQALLKYQTEHDIENEYLMSQERWAVIEDLNHLERSLIVCLHHATGFHLDLLP